MNNFERALCDYLGEENLKKIQTVKIGIAGAGGLGSNCAFNLVRSGFKEILIVDFDKVEFSNLNRQFYFADQIGQYKVETLRKNLLGINPDAKIEIKTIKVSEDNVDALFKDCDIVVEAFDKAEDKKMLIQYCLFCGKFIVAASGVAGWGNSDELLTRKVKNNFYLIGDLQSEVKAGLPPVSPRVNIAAAKQADVILNYVLSR